MRKSIIDRLIGRHEGRPDEEFIHSLYKELLGREGDPQGITHYLDRLRQGKISRGDLITNFLESEEFRFKCSSKIPPLWRGLRRAFNLGNISAGVTARFAYRLILNRPIDTVALRLWRKRLRENRSNRVWLINSLFMSTEYANLVTDHPLSDQMMLNYLHKERCKLVRSLPQGDLIVDLGGSSPNNPRGALLAMGYPHKFRTLLIVDLPVNESLKMRMAKETYHVVQTELGEVRYVYQDMRDIGNLGIQGGSVDLFWMGQSVEHIEESDFDKVLQLIYKYLKPGGYFCFDTPNRLITFIQSPNRYIHPDHKIEYFFENLVKKLKKAGFEIIQTLGIGLADESIRQNRFLPGYMIENIGINQDPEHSYIFYFKTKKNR